VIELRFTQCTGLDSSDLFRANAGSVHDMQETLGDPYRLLTINGINWRYHGKHCICIWINEKNFQFKTVCNGDTAYITQLKQQKSKGDITWQHIAITLTYILLIEQLFRSFRSKIWPQFSIRQPWLPIGRLWHIYDVLVLKFHVTLWP